MKLNLAKAKAYLLYAKKAVAVLTGVEGTAVAEGLLSSAQAGTVTAVLGVVSSALAFAFTNGPKPTP